MSNLKVSVIVPVWNDPIRILKCVEALKSQSLCSKTYEIIIVDNGSSDNTYERICELNGITAIQELNPGSYAARNKALQIASGEYLAFTDADCIPSKTWLESLVNCAEKVSDIGVVAGEINFFKDPCDNVENAAVAYESLFSMDQKTYANQGVCITANWLSKRSKLLELSGFNTNMKSGGDHEMAQRITQTGSPVVYCPTAIVSHPARNRTEILKKRRRVIGGAWDKSQSKFKSLILVWRAVKLYIKRTLIILLSRDVKLSNKFSIFGVISSIFFVSLIEIFRLSIGHESSRS